MCVLNLTTLVRENTSPRNRVARQSPPSAVAPTGHVTERAASMLGSGWPSTLLACGAARVQILTTLLVFSDDENSRPASKRPKQGETAERVICHLRCSVERAVVTGGAARLAHARRCPRRLDPRARSDEPEREISSCRRGKFWRLLHRKLTEERRAAPSRPRER